MASVTVVICDVDGASHREAATKRYTLQCDGRKAVMDLCTEHGAPLAKWLDNYAVKPRRRFDTAVVGSVDDIEREKAAAQPAAEAPAPTPTPTRRRRASAG